MSMVAGRDGTGRTRVLTCVAALSVVVFGACASPRERPDTARGRGDTTATDRSTTSTAPTTTRPTTTLPPTTTTTTPPARPGLPAGDDATVLRIVDGDTLRVAGIGGGAGGVSVRLIGIDTPEVAQDQCYAGEATGHLAGLVPPGTPVRLVYDVERLDRYDRTLAYLFRSTDGLFANLAMARDGFAQQLTIAPNVAHADEFGAAVAEARAAGRGLWGAGCLAAPAPDPLVPSPAPAPTPPPGAGCDPSYPGVCIPPPPPDLDCGDIIDRGFTVLPPDLHRFDGNLDGVGCET